MSKPATLQINARGSWRNVCNFDVADPEACNNVMEAGATIATYSTEKSAVRVIRNESGNPEPLMYWTPEAGWVDWRTRHSKGAGHGE